MVFDELVRENRPFAGRVAPFEANGDQYPSVLRSLCPRHSSGATALLF